MNERPRWLWLLLIPLVGVASVVMLGELVALWGNETAGLLLFLCGTFLSALLGFGLLFPASRSLQFVAKLAKGREFQLHAKTWPPRTQGESARPSRVPAREPPARARAARRARSGATPLPRRRHKGQNSQFGLREASLRGTGCRPPQDKRDVVEFPFVEQADELCPNCGNWSAITAAVLPNGNLALVCEVCSLNFEKHAV